MQTVKEYIQTYLDKNSEVLGDNYPGLNLKRLLEDYCQFHQVKENDIYHDHKDTFIKKLEEGVPLQYILKESFFYKSSFYVDSNVLIPRSETEILVEDSINFLNTHKNDSLKVCEIGVGSFVIGLTIAMESKKQLDITGGDVCIDALEVAQINLLRHATQIDKKNSVSLRESDRFDQINENFDLIVSNPPYIKSKKDQTGVHHQTHKYEPHIALYLEDKIYDEWFSTFLTQAFKKIVDGGALFMEGHEDNLDDLKIMAEKLFSRVEIKNDYTGRKRFLYAYK